MEDLPCEMLAAIFGHTSPTTKAALCCVNPVWFTLTKATRTRGATCRDPTKHGGKCLTSRACAVKHAQRLIQQRQWNLLDWMIDRTGPFEGINTLVDEVSAAAASDGDMVRLKRFYTQTSDIDRLLCAAAQYGRCDVIEWLREESSALLEDACKEMCDGGYTELASDTLANHYFYPNAYVYDAAGHGHISVLMQIRQWGHAFSIDYACAVAAKAGHLDVIEWITADGREWDAHMCHNAAAGGHLAILERALDRGCALDERVLECAAENGHLTVVQWLWSRGCPRGTTLADRAARANHFEIVLWLHAQDYPCDAEGKMYNYAARHGRLDVLEWCKANGFTWDILDALERAAKGGHTAVMDWLCNERKRIGSYPGDDDLESWYKYMMVTIAARRGHVHILQWLADHDYALHGEVCEAAAQKGHQHVLCWLRARGCPWDARCCAAAASRGDIDMLLWLRANGCPEDGSACASAIMNRCFATADWCRNNGFTWDESVYTHMARRGLEWMFEWARMRGCPWSAGTCAALASYGRYHTLKWARKNGCPWDSQTCAIAAGNRNYSLLEWALINGCPWDQQTLDRLSIREQVNDVSALLAAIAHLQYD